MVRFKKDDGSNYPDWIEYSFNDMADYKKGPFGSALKKEIFVPKSKNTVKVYEQQNVIGKDWKLERYFITKEYSKKLKSFAVTSGDILVSCAGTIGEVYVIPEEAEEGIINQALMRIRTNNKIVDRDFYIYVFSNMIDKFSRVYSNGSALKNIPPFADLKRQTALIPCLIEQHKITNFLSNVDEVILYQEQEIDNLLKQKNGVLQKLFSQEVRFNADDGSKYPDWEEKDFYDIFNMHQNNTFSRDMLNYESGGIYNIHYGDVLIKFGSIIDCNKDILPYVNTDVAISKYSTESYIKDGDIIIADTAEDYTAGKVSEVLNVEDKKILSGLHTMLCRPKIKFSRKFLGYYMNSEIYHKQIVRLLVGTKVYSINKKVISTTSISFPCLEEQEKIASFLSDFDDAINYAKQELENWNNIKKGLLQQMFI